MTPDLSRRSFIKVFAAASAAVVIPSAAFSLVDASPFDATIIPIDGRTLTRAEYPAVFDAVGDLRLNQVWTDGGIGEAGAWIGQKTPPWLEFIYREHSAFLKDHDWQQLSKHLDTIKLRNWLGKPTLDRLDDGRWAMVQHNCYMYVKDADGYLAGYQFDQLALSDDQSAVAAYNEA